MPPRRYHMTARAASAAATRERIVRAACAVYAREGFRNASMQAVAREADVSPATVLNHFATPNALLAAALETLTADVGLPDPEHIAAAGGLPERIARLVHEVWGCYVRSEKWWKVYDRDRDMPPLQAANDEFFRRVEALVRAALGPGRRDKKSVAAVMTLIGPPTLYGLRGSGLSSEAAAATVVDMLVGWLTRRQR